jgi:hypothetical protein
MILASIGISDSTLLFDSNAQNFINSAGITDSTQQIAINSIVVDFKNYGIWNKMKAVYPFVGGNSVSHSYNLIDTDQYQLTYTVGITHGSLGIKGNGTSYANPGFKPTTVGIGQNDASAGVYLQSWNNNQTMQYGAFGNFALYRSTNIIFPMVNNTISPSYVASTFSGFYQSSRNSSSNLLIKDKNNSVSTLSSTSTPLSSLDFYICYANNYNGSDDFISFFYIGLGLTSGELDNMYTAVQRFQTTLGRQI